MDGRKIGDRIASCCTKKDWRLLRLICQAQGKIPASARSHVPNELFLRPLIISKRGAMSTASALRSWVVASVVLGRQNRACRSKTPERRRQLGRRSASNVPGGMVATGADADRFSVSHGPGQFAGRTLLYLRR